MVDANNKIVCNELWNLCHSVIWTYMGASYWYDSIERVEVLTDCIDKFGKIREYIKHIDLLVSTNDERHCLLRFDARTMKMITIIAL